MTSQTLQGANVGADVAPHEPSDLVSRSEAMLGGHVGVHLRPCRDRSLLADPASEAEGTAEATLRRISAWAARLTRFTTTSELSRLNGDPRAEVRVGPTLATVLDWSRFAEGLTNGIVDIGWLDARLAAEGVAAGGTNGTTTPPASMASRSWSMERRARGVIARRPVGLRFDLDGVGKGWLADRALDRLGRYPAAVVDADGDIAIRLDAGEHWSFGVADPRRVAHDLAILRMTGRGATGPLDGRFGLATSGISVHRWDRGGRTTHHLIDPRTGDPSETDVVQATVIARTAREAEVLAKAAVILGTTEGYDLLDRAGVDGALILTADDRFIIHPATMRWLS